MPPKPDQQDVIQHDRLLLEKVQPTQIMKQKRFVKRYRTEVAASISSILSTFAAVCHMYHHLI